MGTCHSRVVADDGESAPKLTAAQLPVETCFSKVVPSDGESAPKLNAAQWPMGTCISQPEPEVREKAPDVTASNDVVYSRTIDCLGLENKDHVFEVFRKFADSETNLIAHNRVIEALCGLGIYHEPDDIPVLFGIADFDQNGGLDFDEFQFASKFPSKVEQWLNGQSILKLLSFCMTFDKSSENSLRRVSQLTDTEIDSVVTVFAAQLKIILRKNIRELNGCFSAMDQQSFNEQASGSKFQTFVMSSGSIRDFHKGFGERVGFPHPVLAKGMRDEHCAMAGSERKFTTTSYGLTTTPKQEYLLAVGETTCPPEHLNDRNGKLVRKIQSTEELEKLEICQKAALTREEIQAVVLYTGPMFQVYNTILRQFPVEDFTLFQKGGNLYSTTIHILVSAVVKLARSNRLPVGLELYRGLGGLAELPDSFRKLDEQGCRGYLEWGFLSTTSNKTTAIQYSGIKEGKPRATVLRMVTGAVDRGACIEKLSQYPSEREFLWVPCSFLEPAGAPMLELVPGEDGSSSGVVTVVPVMVKANLKALTVEELRGQKKSMHMTAFRYLIMETQRDLAKIAEEEYLEERVLNDQTRTLPAAKFQEQGGRLDGLKEYIEGGVITFSGRALLDKIIADCRKVMARHAEVGEERFADHQVYRGLASEMLEARSAAMSTLHNYLENLSYPVAVCMRVTLGAGHIDYTSMLWRTLPVAPPERAHAARKLCRVMGILAGDASPAEADEDGFTRLSRAAADGAGIRVIRCLLEARADANHRGPQGRTALWMAAQGGYADVARELLRLGADPDAVAGPLLATPAWVAAQSGHADVLEVLAAGKADLDRASATGRSPLFMAVLNGHEEAVAALRRHGAEREGVEREVGCPVELAAQKNHQVLSTPRRLSSA